MAARVLSHRTQSPSLCKREAPHLLCGRWNSRGMVVAGAMAGTNVLVVVGVEHRQRPPLATPSQSTKHAPAPGSRPVPSPDARQQTSIAMEGVDNFSFGVLSIAIDSYQSFSPRNPVSYVGRSKATHWVRLAHQRNPAGESYHW